MSSPENETPTSEMLMHTAILTQPGQEAEIKEQLDRKNKQTNDQRELEAATKAKS